MTTDGDTGVRLRLAALVTAAVVVLAIAMIGFAVLPERDRATGSAAPTSQTASAAATSSPDPSVRPSSAGRAQLTADERALADAYLALSDAHDRQVVELQIANPLAEYDLVGVPLTDLLDQTRQQLADLPPLATATDLLSALDRGMAATVALLRAIDPHGPRSDQATSYMSALDYWADQVSPTSERIRAILALPPAPMGDLQL